MRNKLRSAFFIAFSFITISNAIAQSNIENEVNVAEKPVYYSLSKALRNAEIVYKLDLSKKKLKEFPIEILKLKELRYLILDSNQVTSIPSQINELEKLEYLSLSHNNIEDLPSSLGELSELRFLYLDYNKISVLPVGFFQLVKLKVLFINNNNLIEIPPEIKVFRELKRLVASNNQFENIPDEIGHLYNLENVTFSNNHIKSLPEHFYELSNLKYLYLSDNDLKKIDSRINKLNKLEILALENNKLKYLPSEIGELFELQSLYLYHNEIDSLPLEIGSLFKLKNLFIGSNPIKEIPTLYNRLSNLEVLNLKDLSFNPFPQVLYDLQNNGTKIVSLKTNELYQAKLLLSQARNKKLTENFIEAINKYEELIRIDTNNVTAMSELASVLIDISDFDKAAVVCKRALSKNASQKTLDEIRAKYSNSINRTNKYDEIIYSYKSKINGDSNNVIPYFQLGKFYYDQKKYEEAKIVLQKAIKISPSHSDSHFYLAVIFLILEQKELFIFSSLRLFSLEPNSNRTKTTFPFLLTRMNMKSGVETKKGSTSYFDSYIIRNEDNEIIFKREEPMADLLMAMMLDLTKSDMFSNDSLKTDTIIKNVVESAFYFNKSNVEIFQLELSKICKTNKDEIKVEEKIFWDYYLPYYSNLIENGHLEAFSHSINSIRNSDQNGAKWFKTNSEKVEKFKFWDKNYNFD